MLSPDFERVEVYIGKILQLIFRISSLMMSPIIYILNNLTLLKLNKILFFIFILAKIMVIPGFSIILPSYVFNLNQDILSLYASAYLELKSVIDVIRNDIIAVSGVLRENENLRLSLEILNRDLDNLRQSYDDLSLRKDSQITLLNSLILEKQTKISDLEVKNAVLLKDSSYIQYLNMFINSFSLVLKLAQGDVGYSQSDRAMLSTIVANVVRSSTKNSRDTFNASDNPSNLFDIS